MKNRYFLRSGDAYLENAVPYRSLAAAKAQFHDDARQLAKYGQAHTAAIHVAPNAAMVVEYPDYVLSLGSRGGLICEKA
jgi:hypothetical protein